MRFQWIRRLVVLAVVVAGSYTALAQTPSDAFNVLNGNFLVKPDANNYLMITNVPGGAAQSATPFRQLFLKHDENNYLMVNCSNCAGGSGSSPANETSFLAEGGQVAWSTGLTFDVSAAEYYIEGTLYSSAAGQVTLAASDPSNPRIDIIAVNTSGSVVVVQGTAAAAPSLPAIDPGSQLLLSFVTVPAGATQPAGATSTLLYAENAGNPTEWDWTASGASISVNSTNTPRNGTKSIEGTNVVAGVYAQGQIGSGSVDPSSSSLLIIWIRPKAAWANGRGLSVTLRSSGVQKGTALSINRTGSWGFESGTLAYQQIAIPLTAFAVPVGTTINQVRIADFGGAIGFYIDDVSIQGGAASQTPTGITLEQADARYRRLGQPLDGVTIFNGQYYSPLVNDGNSGAADTIDWNAGNEHKSLLTGNVTYTFSNPVDGGRYVLRLKQDGTGGRTVTWPAAVVWPGGVAPTITSGAGKIDVCAFFYDATETKYFGRCSQDYN